MNLSLPDKPGPKVTLIELECMNGLGVTQTLIHFGVVGTRAAPKQLISRMGAVPGENYRYKPLYSECCDRRWR